MDKKSKFAINNNAGVAILMVMSTIALLAFLLADFTYETKINKLRVYNQQDLTQARLNAESGLTFALAKLKLYQEGFNILEKDENLKKLVGTRTLETVVTQPFIFPIDDALLKKANLIQRNAAKEFLSSVILQGKVMVTISSVNGLLNPNTLRVPPPSDGKNSEEEDTPLEPDDQSGKSDKTDDKNKVPPHEYIEKQLFETLNKAFLKKKEEDEIFDAKFGNLDPSLLIKEMKYYVNDADRITGAEISDIAGKYQEDNTRPKHAPLTSLSEVYLLKGWDDQIIDLIKDNLTVHEVSILPVNEITRSQLRALFPSLTDEQVIEFFKYKDGDEKEGTPPKEFNTTQEFKNAIVKDLALIDEKTFDDRVKEYANAGIRLGVAGKLFKVEAKGEFGRSVYTLIAFVDMPVLPSKLPTKKKGTGTEVSESEAETDDKKADVDGDGKAKPAPTLLMEPRVIELIVE